MSSESKWPEADPGPGAGPSRHADSATMSHIGWCDSYEIVIVLPTNSALEKDAERELSGSLEVVIPAVYYDGLLSAVLEEQRSGRIEQKFYTSIASLLNVLSKHYADHLEFHEDAQVVAFTTNPHGMPFSRLVGVDLGDGQDSSYGPQLAPDWYTFTADRTTLDRLIQEYAPVEELDIRNVIGSSSIRPSDNELRRREPLTLRAAPEHDQDSSPSFKRSIFHWPMIFGSIEKPSLNTKEDANKKLLALSEYVLLMYVALLRRTPQLMRGYSGIRPLHPVFADEQDHRNVDDETSSLEPNEGSSDNATLEAVESPHYTYYNGKRLLLKDVLDPDPHFQWGPLPPYMAYPFVNPTEENSERETQVWMEYLEGGADWPPASILKRYWERIECPVDEEELLMNIHEQGWIPGVPRVEHVAYPQEINTNDGIKRKLKYLRMLSLGLPVTSCEDVLHRLKVMYDAILTDWHLLKCGVVHCNIGHGKVLVEPIHIPSPIKKPERILRDGINSVLGDGEKGWTALLVGFNRAAPLSVVNTEMYKAYFRKTDTSRTMCRPVELTEGVERERRMPNVPALEELLNRLRSVESLDPQAYVKAFPDSAENEAFIEACTRVIEAEKQRKRPSYTDPRQPYLPHHSIESFYWEFLYSFSRSLPEGEDYREDPDSMEERSEFGSVMLYCNSDVDSRRREYLFCPEKLPPLFHPNFRHFSKLFQHMATYLSVPWKDYMEQKEQKEPDDTSLMNSMLDDFALPWQQTSTQVERDHAHMAFLRLLLADILEYQDRNVQLNWRSGRIMDIDEKYIGTETESDH